MDLERLSEFVVLTEEGSFKQAAKRLQMAPNVLSTRFAAFERSLGMKLIERDAHHFELTEAGRRLSQEARVILGSYEQTMASMRSLHGASFTSLRLQLCAQTMPMELGPYLDISCRRHPTLFLDLYDENSCEIREGLRSGQVDISFAVGREGDFEDISGRVRLDVYPRMKVHLPADHRLARQPSLCFEDLSNETFILYPDMKETWTRRLQLSILEQAQIPYHIYEENCSPFFSELLVPIGKGIRLWNWSERTAPNSVLLPLRDSGYETCLFMLYNRETDNPTTLTFAERFIRFREERK